MLVKKQYNFAHKPIKIRYIMKKTIYSFAFAALFLGVVACGGSDQAESVIEEATEATEEVFEEVTDTVEEFVEDAEEANDELVEEFTEEEESAE